MIDVLRQPISLPEGWVMRPPCREDPHGAVAPTRSASPFGQRVTRASKRKHECKKESARAGARARVALGGQARAQRTAIQVQFRVRVRFRIRVKLGLELGLGLGLG